MVGVPAAAMIYGTPPPWFWALAIAAWTFNGVAVATGWHAEWTGYLQAGYLFLMASYPAIGRWWASQRHHTA